MSALTNLGVVLTAIFIISLAVLAAQISWVIWRRNRFLRYNDGVVRGGDTEGVRATKELLYFCCWKDSQLSSSRVEPDGRAVPNTQGGNVSEEDGENEMPKWHAMHRESRMLYTINEEEKEGEAATESDSSGGGGLPPIAKGKEEDGLGREMEAAVAVNITEESPMELTPFSTPYGSPDRYFTPSPSPPRAEQDGISSRDYAKTTARC
ncbi:hypothetical protein MLD38_035565 [Melastoma candidum]|uniref:Uncharacterized protein n=1 Tax=Melastoma candidum TaxID=119954 RepID=A0ACB9LH00_9MYRT|nr:hypothetical protein MLD38_035565 [Melastoma candidum]